jgi:hypothetical protein
VKAAIGSLAIALAVLAGCSEGTTKVSAADPDAGVAGTTTAVVLPPSTALPPPMAGATVAPGMPLNPPAVTLVPAPVEETGVYRAGIPITVHWGGLDAMLQGLASCSLRTAGCDARSRAMPGFTGGTGVPVTLEVADLDALVSIRVESVATGAVEVDEVDQTGTPTFTSPTEPGYHLVGIDLTGQARSLSYAFVVLLSPSPPSFGATAMTFPVNVAPPAG